MPVRERTAAAVLPNSPGAGAGHLSPIARAIACIP